MEQNVVFNALTQQLAAKDKQIEILLTTNAHLVEEIKKLVTERDALLAGRSLPSSSATAPVTPTTTTTTTTTTKSTSQGSKKRKMSDADTPSPSAGTDNQQTNSTPTVPPTLVEAEKGVKAANDQNKTANEEKTSKRKRKRKGSEAATQAATNGTNDTQQSQSQNQQQKPAKAQPQSQPDKVQQPEQQSTTKPPKKKKKGAKQEPAKPELPVDADKIKKTTKAKDGGLAWVDSVVGTGAVAAPGKKLVVAYKGYLRNGKMFDSSSDKGFSFRLGFNQVIAGWEKGMLGMRVGGKRKLVIPPKFAYGNKALPQIPANSTLCFDIELLSVS